VNTVIPQTGRHSAVGGVGEVSCFLTGIVHLILAVLPANKLNYRLFFAVTTAPPAELSLEPKGPAVYQDDEEGMPALDV